MSEIENAINWAVNVANDNSHGYDQINRWGPDYDCSSFIISAFEQAGVPVKTNGATYTGNMLSAFLKSGFKVVKLSERKRGDVLLNTKHHTALYLGNGQIVQASINEKGKISGGKTGDQTGKEISVGNYYVYSKGWDYCLRYDENKPIKGDVKVNIEVTVCKNGSKNSNVGLIQLLLNRLGYTGKNGRLLTIDDDFGNNTEYAVRAFQQKNGLGVDGIVGKSSWGVLLSSEYKE